MTVATSVAVAAGRDCTEAEVRARLKPGELFTDWEDSPAVPKSTARRVRAELIAERAASFRAGIAANAEVDRQKRQAERERVEAAKRQRASEYLGPRVSAPGAAPAPWMPEDNE